MSGEESGPGLDATLREFTSGQKLFNRYTLIKTLGRGGMGVVWLARDEELERDVALKFLPDLIVRDRAVLSDMKRETRRSLELTHKNIVRIHDFIYDERSGCISMEYIDGDTLSNLRVDKPHKVFEPAELADWTSQLCDALDYAHNHARIIHRDLKPSNLMVNARGELKVADFGIARSLNESVSVLTMHQGRSGTLLYMSPQQLEGERGSHLDDIYSVGASLYELITSKPPFYFGNIDRQIREKIPPRMTVRRQELEIEGPPISPLWENLVRSCLDKNPQRRPQSVAEIAEQLEVPPPKTRKSRSAKPQPSKSRIGPLVALSVLVALGGIAAWYFGVFQSRSKPGPVESSPPVAPSVAAAPTVETKQIVNQSIEAAEKEYDTGMQYLEGMNKVQIDSAKAVDSFRRAADLALPEAKVELAIRVKQSNATDQAEAQNLAAQALADGLEKRATIGKPAAQEAFAKLYAWGLGVPREPAKTVELCRAAADQSYAPAQDYLASLYKNGFGVPKDINKAIQQYEKAAAQGYADSQYILGLGYRAGPEGWPKDLSRAAQMLERAVSQGHIYAPTDLGRMYETGDGVPRNLEKAAEIYRIGASKGNGPAKKHLQGVEQALASESRDATSAQSVAPSPSVPKLPATPGSTYAGTIHVKNDSSISVPLTITLAADPKTGTMTQSGRRGDVVVKFTGVWEGPTLHAVTDQVVSTPKGINWQPESFTLRFGDDGKTASYECVSGGKDYIADLSRQEVPVPAARSVYKGTIRPSNVPLTITLAADHKSGTMTQTGKAGDVVVKFNGVWDGTALRAVTGEVISKPNNIKWDPESFVLRFSSDGKTGTYECNSEGHTYTAELSAP